MTDKVAERLEASAFRYAQSHQNDPLGCAIAKEVLAVIREDGLVERSNRVGTRFLHKLRHLVERYDVVKDARGRGLMITMEFQGNDEHFALALVHRELVARGLLVGFKPAANLLRFYPSLTIGEEDVAQLLENLDRILEALQ
jgi:acetylornithine/N-succinyldiaminopimelate aminotransferase